MRPSHLPSAALTLALLLLAAPLSADAQATVGGQGFGYPPGQLGTRARGMAGANAEHDAESPINPAALGTAPRTGLFFQYAPEFRVTEVSGIDERSSVIRFPLVGGVARLGERLRVGLAASALLDRTFDVRAKSADTVNGEEVLATDRFRSDGGIGEFRLAASWQLRRNLLVGAGVHAVTGENRISVERSFGDTLRLPLESRTLSYSGGGLSVGAAWQLSRVLSVAASAKRGTDVRARSGDTLLSTGRAPDRIGGGIQFTGITGTTLAARAEWIGWSSLAGLGSSRLGASDGWDVGAGADVAGPRFGDRVMLLRAGARWRELPFAAVGSQVREFELAGGIGIPLAYERSAIDLAVQRDARSAGDARERAWTISLGVTVRP